MFIDDLFNDSKKELTNENLRKWFKEKWVRFGPDGKIRGDCARGDESEGKPKCLPQAKAHALGKKGRKTAASRKRREDPNPERRGPAKNVATKKKSNEGVAEGIFDFIKQPMPEHGDELKIGDRYVIFDDGGSHYGVSWIKKDRSEAYEEFDKSEYTDLNELKKAIWDEIKYQDQRGMAEGFTDDLDNIYAMHPQPEKSEQVVFLITGMTEDEFSNRWTDLPDPYQQEFGYDLPLWDADDLSSYPNLAVKRITFDQYVRLVGNYIKSEEIGGSALSKMKRGVAEERLDELKCWPGYHRVKGTKAGFPGSCAKNKTNEEVSKKINPDAVRRIQQLLNTKFNANLDVDGILGPLTLASIKKFLPKSAEKQAPNPERTTAVQGKQVKEEKCPHCGGEMVSEELINEKKDACYYKVKSRYKVWPSAYASGALVQCRKRGAKNWGTKSESIEEAAISTERYTLYINGNPAAYYTDEVDAMTALKELKTAYPKTKIQIMRQECKDEPWSKIMESAQVEAWGLRYNPKTERKEYWKKVFDNQQLARAFVDKFNFELLGLIPVQDKTTNSNYIKENNNRFYFDVGKSTSATDLRNKFHLRHDSNGWYLREGQENFKQYLRNAMKTFTVIK